MGSIIKRSFVAWLTLAVIFGGWCSLTAQTPRPSSEEPKYRWPSGFIHPEKDFPHLGRKPRPDLAQAQDLPARWDWRELGGVTPVKNQRQCGSCYAFAAIANVESALAIRGDGIFDLSENNVKECTWGDPSCSGGGYNTVASYLAKKGTVLEVDDPYIPDDVECDEDGPFQHALLDWRIASLGVMPDPIVLKQYVYEYGPVQSSVCVGNSELSPDWEQQFYTYDGSYTMYTPDKIYGLGHAVLIVGWDDSLTHDGGSGGWIVKNSWGTEWGGPCGFGNEGGYFTIAYGSAEIGSRATFIQDWKEYDPNERLLYYDDAFAIAAHGFDDVTAWGMCAFVQPDVCYLSRVEFWTTDLTTDIDIYIYDDFDGNALSNLLTSKLDATYTEAGYHSVALDSLVEVPAGDDFFVAVKLTNEIYEEPIMFDQQGVIEVGKTFMSPTGAPGTWKDVGSGEAGVYPGDVAIRVRISGSEIPQGPGPVADRYVLSNAYPNPFNSHTTIAYSIGNDTRVELIIYNILGQEVKTLVNDIMPAGEYTAAWDGTNFTGKEAASGIYLYQLRTEEFVDTRKLILLK